MTATAVTGAQTLVLLAQIDRQQQVDAAPVGFSLPTSWSRRPAQRGGRG